jgi:glycosyltransferase involved in cell wall biosynthesis
VPEPRLIDLVTHFFPPLGGPASNRLLGWARHFAARGIAVRVTAPVPHTRDPYFNAATVAPPEIEVHHAAGADLARHWRGRGRWRRLLLPWRDMLDLPDHRRIWNAAALRSLGRLEPAPEILLTTSPYNSTHLIGLLLKRQRPGLLWIADFRDLWFQQWDRRRHTPLHRAYGRRLEGQVVQAADLLVFFHEAGIAELAGRVGDAAVRHKALAVYHGYGDAAAARFAATPADPAREPLRLAFAGTIWEWNLPPGFLEAFRAFRATLGRRVELHLCGRIEPGPLARIGDAARSDPGSIVVHGCLSHPEALDVMARAAVLLVFSGPYRESVSGKLFECMAARRPILYFGRPDSAGAEILRSAGAAACVCDTYDEGGVGGLFARLAAALGAGETNAFSPPVVPPELAGSAQAERLLARIRELASGRA